MATITFKGDPVSTVGDLPVVGSDAPGFRLVNRKLKDVSLHDFSGKKKILNIFPSIDTPVCSSSVMKFNERASTLDDAVVLCISADLPFAQARYCGTENLEHVVPLSMMRSRSFAKDYGVLIEDGPLAGLAARAIVVLDADNKVLYTQLVKEIADEPDYDAAVSALS